MTKPKPLIDIDDVLTEANCIYQEIGYDLYCRTLSKHVLPITFEEYAADPASDISSLQVMAVTAAIINAINSKFEPIESPAPPIADQDALMPDCPHRCNLCEGSYLKHHWMIGTNQETAEDGDPDGSLILVCRHCDQKILQFDVCDPNCPDH